MNTAPTNPLHGPAPPPNVLVPAGGHPHIFVQDPPDQAPDEEVDPIPIISEQLAPGLLANMNNVRASFPVGLGTPHMIRSLGRRGLTVYTTMTRNKWNSHRLDFNSPQGVEIRDLLHAIYQSVIHHQEQLIFHGVSSVYALPRAKKFWIQVIAVLLAPFDVQFYLESNRANTASIWGDFANSQRPHPADEDYYVDLALNMEM